MTGRRNCQASEKPSTRGNQTHCFETVRLPRRSPISCVSPPNATSGAWTLVRNRPSRSRRGEEVRRRERRPEREQEGRSHLGNDAQEDWWRGPGIRTVGRAARVGGGACIRPVQPFHQKRQCQLRSIRHMPTGAQGGERSGSGDPQEGPFAGSAKLSTGDARPISFSRPTPRPPPAPPGGRP